MSEEDKELIYESGSIKVYECSEEKVELVAGALEFTVEDERLVERILDKVEQYGLEVACSRFQRIRRIQLNSYLRGLMEGISVGREQNNEQR